MEKFFNVFSLIFGFVGGILSYCFGGFDILFITLICMTVLDYITGVLNACLSKTLSSSIGFKGIIKKVMIYTVVVCAVMLDKLMGGQLPLREVVITFFIANEGVSLLENVSPYLPIPEQLKDVLLQLRDNKNNKSEEWLKMNITNNYLPISKYHRPGTKIKPSKIAVHYVGNAGSSAKGNRNYFASCSNYVSSHYIIGLNGEILRLIPENEISYCTNQANSYTISIECCHPDGTGKFNDKTLEALIELCADICKRYGFNPLTDIIRHYDVTKKACPLWWAPNGPNKSANADFIAFKNSVKNKIAGDEKVVKQNIKINGKVKAVNAINKDGYTYIKIRDLSDIVSIGYDKETKLISVSVK